MVSILGWIVETLDNTFHADTFLLADPKKGKHNYSIIYKVLNKIRNMLSYQNLEC
jgi:hypothetical protein